MGCSIFGTPPNLESLKQKNLKGMGLNSQHLLFSNIEKKSTTFIWAKAKSHLMRGGDQFFIGEIRSKKEKMFPIAILAKHVLLH